MPGRVELAITSAVRDTAELLGGTASFKEKELCACFGKRLSARLDQSQSGCEVYDGELPVTIKEWPGVGRVDLAINDPLGVPYVFFELKCGAGTLFNCVWDVAKLGVVSARGLAKKAYLLAAAPTAAWYHEDGAELFNSHEWTATYLLEAYKKYWEGWQTAVKTRPAAIPVSITTEVVAVERIGAGDAEWLLRLTEVKASPEDWLDVSSGIKLSRWLTHFTWKAGDVDILTEAEAREVLGDEVIDQAKLAEQQRQVESLVALARDVASDPDLELGQKLAKIRELEREAAAKLQTDSVPAVSCYLEQVLMQHSPPPF